MDELISKIEDVVLKLIMYDNEGYAVSAQELATELMTVLPDIIGYYADPKMAEHASDAKYWPAQLERILQALSAGDDLATFDVLYNETRANLIELKGILRGKGIV